MKTFTFLLLSVLLSLSFQSVAMDFYPEKQALKAIKSALKEKDVTSIKKMEVSQQEAKSEPVAIYRISRENGEDVYVVFTQATGRYDVFDYMISVNLELAIEKVRVLKYRSEYGGEIASKKWLSQFENYASGEELRYKKEISALSGATMSANSIVADIPKVLNILESNCN